MTEEHTKCVAEAWPAQSRHRIIACCGVTDGQPSVASTMMAARS